MINSSNLIYVPVASFAAPPLDVSYPPPIGKQGLRCRLLGFLKEIKGNQRKNQPGSHRSLDFLKEIKGNQRKNQLGSCRFLGFLKEIKGNPRKN